MRSCLSQLSNKYCDCDLPFSMSFSVGKRWDFLWFGNWKPTKTVISKLLRRYLTNKGCFSYFSLKSWTLLKKVVLQRVIPLVNLEMMYPIRIFVLFHVFYVTGPKRVSNLQLTKLNERLDWSAQCELTNKNILPCLTCYFNKPLNVLKTCFYAKRDYKTT